MKKSTKVRDSVRAKREPKPEPILTYGAWCESLAKKQDEREPNFWTAFYGHAPSKPMWNGFAWVGSARGLRPL